MLLRLTCLDFASDQVLKWSGPEKAVYDVSSGLAVKRRQGFGCKCVQRPSYRDMNAVEHLSKGDHHDMCSTESPLFGAQRYW